MEHRFDKTYWERHWKEGDADGPGAMSVSPPNPHLVREIGELTPGTALDAGCGAGAEALWLASHGWQVTAVDVSAEALAQAAERATAIESAENIRWVEADLDVWDPEGVFGLVTTHYAHSSLPQLELYDRLASWVAPGGTLLIVGHLHTHDMGEGHDHHPPAEASVTLAAITARLDGGTWQIVTAEERQRTVSRPGGREIHLDDVVVRAVRRG